MINISQLNQRYGGSHILWDVDMNIAQGSRTCIMGRNGVGKTTLLKCLMGLLPSASGSITINEQDVTKSSIETRANIGVGYVPQGRHIFGQLTVEENLKVSLNCKRQKSRTIPEEVFEYFPVLKEMLQRRGGDLSGGQILKTIAEKALNLDEKGLAFYKFDIEDKKAYKTKYRETLNTLPLTTAQQNTAITEANFAFRLNMYMFDELEGSSARGLWNVFINTMFATKG